MKTIRIVHVGRPKAGFWQEAAAHYEKLLSRFVALSEETVKDAPAALPPEARKSVEGRAILSRLGAGERLVCLDEHGRSMTSRELSAWLTRLIEDPACPVFVVGGPYGLSAEVLERASERISLSPLTLPHELARVVLLEQLYRAVAIARNLPYHND
jgi:23S rRNA (pseudouridine1915-N3)-methyltransferase